MSEVGEYVMAKLTPKQKAFCDYYIETGNASESARKAGYSGKTAFRIGQENLQKPAIKKYITDRMIEIESKRIMDQQEALELLTSIARGEIEEEVIIATPKGYTRATKKADINQRQKAIDSLLKRYLVSQLDEAKLKKMQAEIELIHERINQLKDAAGGASELVDEWVKAVTDDG